MRRSVPRASAAMVTEGRPILFLRVGIEDEAF